MECKNSIYHCLCAYLLDDRIGSEEIEFIRHNPELCPKCSTCSKVRREEELKLQRKVKTLIQNQNINVIVPENLKKRVKLELGRAEDYRESGISVLDLLPWGTHFALLYSSKDELIEILIPYIKAGLEQNELCIWITFDLSGKEIDPVFAEEILNFRKFIETGQLQITSYIDWLLSEKNTEGQCILDNCLKKCQQVFHKGYSGFRIAGDAFWTTQSEWDSLLKQEIYLDEVIPNYNALVLCNYKEDECNKDRIENIVNAHKYVLSKVDGSWKIRK